MTKLVWPFVRICAILFLNVRGYKRLTLQVTISTLVWLLQRRWRWHDWLVVVVLSLPSRTGVPITDNGSFDHVDSLRTSLKLKLSWFRFFRFTVRWIAWCVTLSKSEIDLGRFPMHAKWGMSLKCVLVWNWSTPAYIRLSQKSNANWEKTILPRKINW